MLCYSVVVVYRGGGGSEKKGGEEGAEGVEGGRWKERRGRGGQEARKRGRRGRGGVEEATENINLVKNTPNNLVFKKISCNFGWK